MPCGVVFDHSEYKDEDIGGIQVLYLNFYSLVEKLDHSNHSNIHQILRIISTAWALTAL